MLSLVSSPSKPLNLRHGLENYQYSSVFTGGAQWDFEPLMISVTLEPVSSNSPKICVFPFP